ncbi:MAG: DUF192 domain-containing protein [Halorientalis sp.]
MPSKVANALTAGLVLIAVVAIIIQTGVLTSPPDDYQTATVTLQDQNGTTLSTVAVRIADTRRKRYVGLSDTESLGENEGMLFVHPSESHHAYVMRDMAFPLDIVFVDANGTITRIHHAELESNASNSALTNYEGTGKYVLEVNHGFTNRTGVDVGDRVVIPGGVA